VFIIREGVESTEVTAKKPKMRAPMEMCYREIEKKQTFIPTSQLARTRIFHSCPRA
jgi:hypothetical protein